MNSFASTARTKAAPKSAKVTKAKAARTKKASPGIGKNPVLTRTANGALTLESSLDAAVDLFAMVGSARNARPDALKLFKAAMKEDLDVAVRVALWSRDAREGAGERQTFREMLLQMVETIHPKDLLGVIRKVPELGRWDDLLVLENSELFVDVVAPMIRAAINEGNGLAAKWMPRKGAVANKLRKAWDLTSRQYRKFLVENTSVVESLMCANEWQKIDFSKVPSIASHRYKKAFQRRLPERFTKFAKAAAAGEAKVNASVIYPYQLVNDLMRASGSEHDLAVAQWEQMPNWMAEGYRVLPMIDVSGSMSTQVAPGIPALHVAMGVGLYVATKQPGDFRDLVLNFSPKAELIDLKPAKTLKAKLRKIHEMAWELNTNLQAAFEHVLEHAKKHKVPQDEMPTHLLVISDMEFDVASRGGYSTTNHNAAEEKFTKAGYKLPKVVYWNVNGRAGNNPVSFKRKEAAMVSGFSPSILKSILSDGLAKFTPRSVMLETVMKDRYSW